MRLTPYTPKHLGSLFSWIGSAEEMYEWGATSFEYPLNESAFHDFPERFNAHAFWLLDHKGVVSGMGDIVVDDERKQLRLCRIIISPKQRGKGLGASMTRLLVEEAHRINPDYTICLWVITSNTAAQKAYSKAGFSFTEESIEFEAGGKKYPCQQMIHAS